MKRSGKNITFRSLKESVIQRHLKAFKRSEKASADNSLPPSTFLKIGCNPSRGKSFALLMDSLAGHGFVLEYKRNAFVQDFCKEVSSAEESIISRTLSETRSRTV